MINNTSPFYRRLLSPFLFLLPLSSLAYGSTDYYYSQQINTLQGIEASVTKTITESEKLSDLKPALLNFFSLLSAQGHIQRAGTDQEVRPCFVNVQGLIEQSLAYALQRGEITDLTGIIHTPTPATPLCTDGQITDRLVHPSMQNDESRIFTVRARANILRDYLDMGGKLFVVYPEGGLQKRSEEQQNTYLTALQEYSQNLHNHELQIDHMDNDMVGATYLFKDQSGEEYMFSIRATQANAPVEDNAWEMWFGKSNQPEIAQRIERVRSYLNELNGPLLTLN